MSVSLFGPPQIKRGQETLAVQRRKDLALLIYLIVTSQPHSRDTLATLLWQDQDQTSARSNLRKSLSRLKALLGEEIFLYMNDQVGINPNISIDIDVTRFDLQLQKFKKHRHVREDAVPHLCSVCQAALEEATRLHHAGFLEGFSLPDSSVFEEWQFFQSENFRKHLREILEHLTHQYTHAENYSTAIEYCQRWLSLDRLHEPAHRQLMLLYALAGQHAAALRQYNECRRLLEGELGIQPEAGTVQLYEAIRKKELDQFLHVQPTHKTQAPQDDAKTIHPSGLQRGAASKLPIQPTPFIGREKELGKILQLLNDPACRVLTLMGPGGSGKTRLAVQTAYIFVGRDADNFRDGILFIPLAPHTGQNSVLQEIARQLFQSHLSGKDARKQVLEFLQDRDMLLILDNFEHVLGEVSAGLITAIAEAAPNLKLLITSRERLNIHGEFIFPVEGLETSTEETAESDALALFEQSARRVQASFRITEDNRASIVRICNIVQGMPLAIELAASWLEILSPGEIRTEISQSLDFLQSNWRDLPDRQRSLRAVFDSSWDMLDGQTRPVIKALSVFRSSFTREAAQAVSGASTKKLLDLTNKSWIQRLSNGRYQIHELLKQFAFKKLESEKTSFIQVRQQYTEFYAGYADALWVGMKGPGQAQAYSDAEREFENIQTAWTWMVEDGKVEEAVQNILPALFHYVEIKGKVGEFLQLIEAALQSLETARKTHRYPDLARLEIILRTVQGAFYSFDGLPLRFSFFEAMFPVHREAINRAWSLSERKTKLHELGIWGILLAFIHGWIGHTPEAIQRLKDAIPRFRESDQAWELASANLHLSKLLLLDAENRELQAETIGKYLSEALEIFTSLGDEINCSNTLGQRGILLYHEHKLKDAIQQWDTARSILLAKGEWAAATTLTWKIGDSYIQLGEFDKAFSCFREISTINLKHGFKLDAVGALSKESYEKVRYGDLLEALHIRQQCLDIIQSIGPEYQIGWNYWEMGEIERVMDKLADAAAWYEKACKIFEKFDDNVGLTFYHRGSGDIALARGDYRSARQYFSTSASLARLVKHDWGLIYALNGMVKSELRLNEQASAKRHLQEALKMAGKTGDRGVALLLLTGAGEYFKHRGQLERAAQLGSLVNSHHASWRETKRQAAVLLESLQNSMPLSNYNTAVKMGRTLDIWDAIENLIHRV